MPRVYEEQCELFIEQEIEDGIRQGKTPYSIGKEISAWVENLFGRVVKPDTVRKRVERTMDNVHKVVSSEDISENEEKQKNQIYTCPLSSCKELFYEKVWHCTECDHHWPSYIEECKNCISIGHGGKRKGAGRPAKYQLPESEALHFRARGTGENEWYTPPRYIELVRKALGRIELDPASSIQAQKSIKASEFFSKEEDGLSKKWFGNVFLNPPYTQPDVSQFVSKLVSEYQEGRVKQAILLTHNYTDTAWFHEAANACAAICFTKGRIAFEAPDGTKAQPTQGQAFFYFGPYVDDFRTVFEEIGFVR